MLLEEPLHSRHITIVFNNESEIKEIECNKTTITTALYNVIYNGIIYGAAFSEQKSISLNIQNQILKNKLGLSISVVDHGPGINKKEISKIFKPFTRGFVADRNQIPGSGIGLYVAKKIIIQHKGSIRCVSKLNEETRFEIWMPHRIN